MSVTCGASVTWFREPGHIRVDDRCVLENGHMDYDHLAAGKAAEQVENRIWNEAVDTTGAAVIAELITRHDWTVEKASLLTAKATAEVRRGS